MKNIIFLLLTLFALTSCTAQNTNAYKTTNNSINDSISFEKFNLELAKRDYESFEFVKNSYKLYGGNGFYKLDNGAAFSPGTYSYKVITPFPYFNSYWYEYHTNTNLKEYGKIAGSNSGIQIGVWKYYDENGKLTKEEDEDRKFGSWSFEKVLEQLNKDKVIDLATGRNREANHLRFYFDEVKKLWKVKVFWKMKNEDVEKYWEYIFDSNTGKYTRDWYEEYIEEILLMMGDVKNHFMPPLKNSKQRKQKKAY